MMPITTLTASASIRLLFTAAALLSSGCAGQDQAPAPPEKNLLQELDTSMTEEQKQERLQELREGQRKFAGLNFGVGISLTVDTGDNDRINSAEIVNDIVRVSDEDKTNARVMLESHYFFQPARSFINVERGNWGVGPFIALQPGTDEIIEAVGAGIMLGFRRPDESGQSWNIGFGYVVDPNVQILGDGFVANEAPPANEMQVRYKETSQGGLLILASFSF